MHRAPLQISASAQLKLRNHSWPGNVRELDNLLQRAFILQAGAVINDSDLMFDAKSMSRASISAKPAAVPEDSQELGQDMKHHEYQLILDALKSCRGSRKDAAEKLGISPRTLRYKLARMREDGIDLSAL